MQRALVFTWLCLALLVATEARLLFSKKDSAPSDLAPLLDKRRLLLQRRAPDTCPCGHGLQQDIRERDLLIDTLLAQLADVADCKPAAARVAQQFLRGKVASPPL